MLHSIRSVYLALSPTTQSLLLAWLTVMLGMPWLKYRWKERGTIVSVVASVVLQAAVVVSILMTTWDLGWTLRTALIITVLAWFAEFTGVHTGLPFGHYHYTDRLRPQAGRVPVIIPLAWLMMLPPAWATAAAISEQPCDWEFALFSGLIFTAWDLFLDPQMVAWGLWRWERPGGYFGIPWLNFAGWFLIATLITRIVCPTNLPITPLLLVYGITWLLETVAQLLFWRLYGPAVSGFIGMGCFVLLALSRL